MRQDLVEEEIGKQDQDEEWDAFVSKVSPGNYEQSSAWLKVRNQQGWIGRRLALSSSGKILAGFQIFTRTIGGIFRIGYIPRAPLISSSESDKIPIAIITNYAKTKRIHLIITQSPEDQFSLETEMLRCGFIPNSLFGIINANLVINLNRSWEHIASEMRVHTRQEVRQAIKRGASIRIGDYKDLSSFFKLMSNSCRRQKTFPNPSSLEDLTVIWTEFRRTNSIHLMMVEIKGETVGGLLILVYGNRATFWKKGWTDTHYNIRPNQLLFYEAIRWAHAQGYDSCDFGSLNRKTAENLLSGKPLTEEMKRSRDFFNLGFGGTPVLLPEPMIFITNPILQLCYRIAGPVMGSSCIGRLIRYFSRIRRS